jgi:hypothetical protein
MIYSFDYDMGVSQELGESAPRRQNVALSCRRHLSAPRPHRDACGMTNRFVNNLGQTPTI